jgi:hypothetical protein
MLTSSNTLFSYAETEVFVVVVGVAGVAIGVGVLVTVGAVVAVVVGVLTGTGVFTVARAFTAFALQAFAVLQAVADLQAADVLHTACFLQAAGVVHLPLVILHFALFAFTVCVQVETGAANTLVEPTKIANEASTEIVTLDKFLFIFMVVILLIVIT